MEWNIGGITIAYTMGFQQILDLSRLRNTVDESLIGEQWYSLPIFTTMVCSYYPIKSMMILLFSFVRLIVQVSQVSVTTIDC